MSDIRIEPVPWDDPEATALRDAQQAEICALYGVDDSEPGVKPSAANIALMLLARDGTGRPVGCGALRQIDAASAEIKRMYVPPDLRGRGIARLILARLEDEARARGWTRLLLETGPLQHSAMGLYTSEGYERVGAFGSYPADDGFSVYFGRSL